MSNFVVIGYESEIKAQEVRLTLLKLQTSLSHEDEAKLQRALDLARTSTT